MFNITREELMKLDQPLRYIGGEYGVIKKLEYDTKIRVALCYPNLYDIGMKNYSFTYLYSAINKVIEVSCDRCFLPYFDFEDILKKKNIELFTLEEKLPLNKFDFVIFVISDITEYINILPMLKMANLNTLKEDRPVIVAMFEENKGWHYPISHFFDILVFSDFKVLYNDIFFRFSVYNKQKLSKNDFLNSVNTIDSVIVPSIDINKEVSLNHDNIENSFFINLPTNVIVSSIFDLKQELIIFFESSNKTLDYTLRLIKNTGIKNLKIKVSNNVKFDDLMNFNEKLLGNYNFLNIKFDGLPFNDKTLEIYKKAKLMHSKIYYDISKISLLKNKYYEEKLTSDIILAFKNGVYNVCIKTKIGQKNEKYDDLEELVKFITKIKEIYFNDFLPKRNLKLNISLKLENALEDSINKMELKYKFLNEKLNDIKVIYDPYNLYVLKKILIKKDDNVVKLLEKLDNNNIRIYGNPEKLDNSDFNNKIKNLNLNKFLKYN